MTCSKKNDEMKAMLVQVITACIKTQLLKLSGPKDEKPWEICQGSHPWLGTPLHASHLTAVATLWIYHASYWTLLELDWNNIHTNTIFKL